MKAKVIKRKEISEKTQKIVFLLVIFAILTSIISATFAWYFDNKQANAVIQFGAIEVDRQGSFFAQTNIIDLIPGEPIVGQVSFKQTERSSPFYARVKLEVSVDPTNSVEGMTELAEELNSSFQYCQKVSTTSYCWVLSGDFYYCTVTGNDNLLYEIANTSPVLFINQWIFDTSYEQFFDDNGNILQYQKKLIIKATVQALQTESLDNLSPATAATYFDAMT